MDRYMNDTHSLYYNVDHSSMFGANLSTVFADGPPPLEDGDDDHGEFVFSSETDAIGEAVLNKIESKLQRDAEERPVVEVETLNSDIESKPNTEEFGAFANFETTNQFDTSGKQQVSKEVNGYKENIETLKSEKEFSDDEFGDFSTGFGQNSTQNFTHNNTSESDRNNSGFADFSSFQSTDFQTANDEPRNNGNYFGSESVANNVVNQSDESDDEFGSFNEANDVESNEIQEPTGTLANANPDVIPTNEGNKLASSKLPLDLTNHETRINDRFASFDAFKGNVPVNERGDLASTELPHDLTNHETGNNDKFESLEAFQDPSSNETNQVTSSELPPDLTNHVAAQNDGFHSFETAKDDDDFNGFTGASDDFENFSEHSLSTDDTKNESQCVENGSQGLTTDVCKADVNFTQGNIASSEDNDFGDFADFSDDSFSTFSSNSVGVKQNDPTFGSFSASADESKFGKFAGSARTNKSHENGRDLSREGNDSKPDSEDFTAFSETAGNTRGFKADFGTFSGSASSKSSQEFNADFGAFSEGPSANNKNTALQDDFGAFSESKTSRNKQGFQADFGAFSQNVSQKSVNQTVSNKQYMSAQTQLVSLYTCFQDVFVTLRCKVEDLEHVKPPGNKRINQEKLWKNLNSDMGDGVLRFSWEQCKTSEEMCKSLDVSKNNIVVNPNVLAMSEGLEMPAFATGLGILQPSIVPVPPKKKKTKGKGMKEATSETQSSQSPTPPPNLLQQQTSFPEVKTESIKDNNSDTASLSNSDTASLDLDFFASAPSNPPVSSDLLGQTCDNSENAMNQVCCKPRTDQSSSTSLYNLEFAFGPAVSGGRQAASLVSNSDMDAFKTSKPGQDDPLEILKKLDTSKMSSSVVGTGSARISARAKEIMETFDDLSFMHSSVLMFPLNKSN